MATSTHEVVVLGANFGGLGLTHYLQRQIFPQLRRIDPSASYHLTLVSPNTHYYYKIAIPRVLANPTSLPTERAVRDLRDSLSQYGDSCTFVQGKATNVNPGDRTVTVDVVGGSTTTLKYDSLFISTGITSESPLWSVHDDEQESLKALKRMHETLPKAKTVMIAGAGPTGVETAGEIAETYPNIKITLVAGSDVLPHTNNKTVISKAKAILKSANVEVLTGVRFQETSDSESGTTVKLSDGSSRTVDIFIDARGAAKVNSEFLPKSWVDQSGYVPTTKDDTFRVKGADGVYAIGDIVAGTGNTAIELDKMIPAAGTAFALDVLAKSGAKAKTGGGLLGWVPGLSSKGITQAPYKPMAKTILVPIGSSNGVGQIMGWSIPSTMVKKLKGETFLAQHIEPVVTGSKYAQL
jgi:NADH dehydrogenase FAD-containing subunit